jgi:hypothetical protein
MRLKINPAGGILRIKPVAFHRGAADFPRVEERGFTANDYLKLA